MIKGKECWDILALKVQCHEIFDHFFALNIRPGPHMNGRKRFRELFSFCESNSRKPVSAWSTTTLTPCQRSQQLQGHGPSVFNDYANMCQRSQRLRGHTGNYFSLEKVKNQQKSNLIFSKICCPRSRWLRWHPIFKLCDRISPRKRKISILSVHIEPRSNLLGQKNGQKCRDTVPLRGSCRRLRTLYAHLQLVIGPPCVQI